MPIKGKKMDEDFEWFLSEFGPPVERRWVPQSSIERYRGRLPDQLLLYWDEHGWTGYRHGLFWTVNPQEYEPVVDAWIGNTKYATQDNFHLIARGAFGDIFLFGERSGLELHIVAVNAVLMEPYEWPEDRNFGTRIFFNSMEPEAVDKMDEKGEWLFDRALQRLGGLKCDEMYGFVPALALGGPPSLKHLQKVGAVEHLVLLAQLSELRPCPY